MIGLMHACKRDSRRRNKQTLRAGAEEARAHGKAAAAQQDAEDHLAEAAALRRGHAGGSALAPLQLGDDRRQPRRQAGRQRIEACGIPAET